MTLLRPVSVKPVDEITVTVRELLVDGAALGEVMAVLRETVFAPKRIILLKRADIWHVYSDPRDNKPHDLYKAPSLAMCVQFALKYEVDND